MQTPDDLSDLVQRLNQQHDAQRPTVPAPALRRRPDRARRRRKQTIIVAAAALVLVLGGGTAAWAGIAAAGKGATEASEPKPQPAPAQESPEPTQQPEQEPSALPSPEPEPSAQAIPQWDIDTPESLQVLVNKQRPISVPGWSPADLRVPNIPNPSGELMRDEAATALEQMYAAAQADGVPFAAVSGFRGYDLQVQLFDNYVARDGLEAAETYSARAGFSEHQTGLVMDVSECSGCALSYEFIDTLQGQWIRDNAYRFGFLVRYNPDQQAIVGYRYEPWHLRYVGTEITTAMHEQGILNYEDYLGQPAAPDYPASARQ